MSPRRLASRLLGCTLATAVVGALAAPASAQDGGVRSVFATGAGNRAVALGGAYAAVADDASAALWNPGGLGWLQRRTLAASYSSLYLGFSEQYVSFVSPSWRFGTFAATLQQFSVDGIDVRDERNFLLGEGESESQTQLSLAYGRALGPDWSLGASFKLRRQSLAGFSDSGFGVDVGVLVHPARALGLRQAWAERLSAGLTVHNAIEPSIRLDQASVADPATARLGVAYWLPVHAQHAVLLATDVEKTSDMDARLHVGVEARLAGTLSLRGGYNGVKTTAGTGVHWREFSFDYVYENTRIEDVHRFGASFRFGLSVEESRLAAQRAAEEAIETRLADEFERRRRTQIDQLLQVAETAYAERRYADALDVLGTARVLDPDDARGLDLEAACHRDQAQVLEADGAFTEAALAYRNALEVRPGDPVAAAGAARCRSLSNRNAERSLEIRALFADAVDAFSAEDFATARHGFTQILELQPEDAEAARMLQRTEEAIAHRSRSHLQLAERLLMDGVLEEADKQVAQARRLDPQLRGLESLSKRIATARQAQAAAAARPTRSEPTPPGDSVASDAPSAERRAEIEDLYQRGLAALADGRGSDAVRYWELVWSFDPDYERVREHLRREYTTQGMELFARGQLDEAIQRWRHALRVDPDDERALAYLSRAQEQLARTRQILGEGD